MYLKYPVVDRYVEAVAVKYKEYRTGTGSKASRKEPNNLCTLDIDD
jgi:hypothetical protein